jgi:uncharacterized protein with FMN-binding domain
MKIMKKIFTMILILVMLTLTITGCGAPPKIVTIPAATYPADVKSTEEVVKGKMGEIKLQVAVKDNKIFEVRILENRETPRHASKALVLIPKEIVKKQSLGIDAVSGATVTTRAILKGTEEALKKLGVDTARLKKE